ncbi:MAG: hypothetical protein H0V81_08450 [Solirubrobacterales bacterium]|nr:hypothetical protein [Solirubrobacterales bacterium]
MSAKDPHAPTPAGPDPDEKTEVHAAADPYAPGSEAAKEAGERAASDTPEGASGETPEAASSTEPTPTVAPADATHESPAGSAKPASEWLAERDAPGPADTSTAPEGAAAQAQALTEKPEVVVGLAFLGGAAVSLILKRFGR